MNSTGRCTWPANRWPLRSVRAGSGFYAEMDQGCAEFGATRTRTCRFAEAFSLSANDLSGHPPRVVSTGLPYPFCR